MKLSVLFLAGGRGTRLSSTGLPKQYLDLGGKPLFRYSFELLKSLGEMIVVADPSFYPYFAEEAVRFALPGERRQDSVKNGFLESSGDWILVHDAARPFVLQSDIESLLEEAKLLGAAALATPLKFTVKQATSDRQVIQTLDRETLWEIQTPQVLKREVMHRGFELAEQNNLIVTDDVSLAELAGVPVKLVLGSDRNFKITTPEDLVRARGLFV